MADEQQIIDIPGVGHVAFPASMSDADVTTAVKKLHEGAVKAAQPPSMLQRITDAAKAGADPLHPTPVMGQHVADVMNTPLVDAPVIRNITTPAALILGAAGAARGSTQGIGKAAEFTGGVLSDYSPLQRPLEPIGDLLKWAGKKMQQPPAPKFGSGGTLPTDMGQPPQSGGPIQIPQKIVFGGGGGMPQMDIAPPTSGGPIQVPPQRASMQEIALAARKNTATPPAAPTAPPTPEAITQPIQEKVPLSELASKTKREMSPIKGISLEDYEALKQISPGLSPEWIKALNPDLVKQFLELRASRSNAYRINAGLDAGAARAAANEP